MKSKPTLRYVLDWYEEEIVPSKKGSREESMVLKVLRTHCADFLELPMDLVGPRHVGLYRSRRQNSPTVRRLTNGKVRIGDKHPSARTIYKDLCILSSAYKHFCESHRLHDVVNPVTHGIRPRPVESSARTPFIGEDVIGALREVAAQYVASGMIPMAPLLEVALCAPMTLEELASLRWGAVCLTRNSIRVGYGTCARTMQLTAPARASLESLS